jgi:hypothetical protein
MTDVTLLLWPSLALLRIVGSGKMAEFQRTAGEGDTIRIGAFGPTHQTATYVAGIYGATVASGVGVIVDSTGHFGTVQSSARFKETIKPMDKASETILALQPVTFRYKHDLDPHGIPQFGLVAEQVEKVDPDLVVRGEDGKVMPGADELSEYIVYSALPAD